jgi:hypothetical protein
MSASARPPHPGRTSAQRRALDAIGCGEPPRCSSKTLKALLDAGLIEETGGEIRRDALGSYRIPTYEMPIPVHNAVVLRRGCDRRGDGHVRG